MASLPGSGINRYALKDGDTFLVCTDTGDLLDEADGMYRDGTRVLSRWFLCLGEGALSLLSAAASQDNVYFVAHLTNQRTAMLEGGPPFSGIHIERTRFLWRGRLHERIACTNYAQAEVVLPLRMEFAADFRDMFEIRGATRARRGHECEPEVSDTQVSLRYEGLDQVVRRTVLAFSERPVELSASQARFQLRVPPRARRELYLEVGEEPGEPTRERFRAAAAKARCAMRLRVRSGARVRSSGRVFNAWLERSRADIALLTSDLATGPYPYAGIPWFSTPFGRDAIITALQTLWLDPRLARGVLAFLAGSQATETSAFRDSAPGKIMHETRKGEMVALGELPFGLYYGGVDTTPLFVMLAGAYVQRTADVGLLEDLWPALLSAMAWIERQCETDPDGFLTYQRGESGGLINQGWKDSGDSVFHADGRMPETPIALIEVQGYVYAALRAMAAMARHRGETEAALHWRRHARRLRAAVEARLWDEELRFYAIARDGRGDNCRVRASNVGHLLYVGLPHEEKAQQVIEQLDGHTFNGGWGIRTLGADQPRFDPMSYHNGSVWPHDVAICAAGMARYGARGPAVRLLAETFEAATHFGMRLPELFCGFPRVPGAPPVAYPVACLPQAWAAGSVFMLLRACLGLNVDAWRREITVEQPRLPVGVDRVQVQGIEIGGKSVSLAFERAGERVLVDRTGGDAEVRVSARL